MASLRAPLGGGRRLSFGAPLATTLLLASLASLASFAPLACGGGSSDDAASPEPAAPPPPPPEAPPAPARSPACVEQDTKLQAALDGARTTKNAMLSVKNAACGTSVYVSGDPKNATQESLWRIGSITKTFTSAVILSLVAEEKIALADPLEKYVPGVPGGDGVTVRMLLNHTSGIFSYTESPKFDQTKTYTPSELVALATEHARYGAPGEAFHYSNTNYVLLGMIAEIAGGAKLGALVRARAIAKAGLTHTFFDGEEPVEGVLAKGFGVSGEDATNAVNMSGPWAAGAIVASGADLAEWVAALYGSNAVLDAPTRALLTEGAITSLEGGTYGLGVIVLPASVTAGGGKALGHDGAIDGYQAQAFYFTGKETAIASVVNSTSGDPNAISLAAAEVLFAKP
jgi:D-alanyl-D-alanine carboxypeptidase